MARLGQVAQDVDGGMLTRFGLRAMDDYMGVEVPDVGGR